MQAINFKYLNGGYYALMIDGEEIGVVYKKEHAEMIETATINLPIVEGRLECLENHNEELRNQLINNG